MTASISKPAPTSARTTTKKGSKAESTPATEGAATVAAAPEAATATTSVLTGRRLKLHKAADVQLAAEVLQKFIKDKKLCTNVQGKEFVNVEGWQYAGSLFGLYALAEHCINVGTDAEMKYQAKVSVKNHKGEIVGCGFAVCSNKESGKKFYQEFAIMSMAQTRAVGKAYRLQLAFLIRLAGFEATPAEEMDFDTNKPAQAQAVAKQPDAADEALAQPAPAMVASTGGAGEAPKQPVQYATAAQKEELIRLLEHPMITRPEKTKMLLNINRLDEERCAQAIAKLRKAIDDRENDPDLRVALGIGADDGTDDDDGHGNSSGPNEGHHTSDHEPDINH